MVPSPRAPRLVVRTRPGAEPRRSDLSPGIVWRHGGEGLDAAGSVAAFDPGTGEGRFARAAAWWRDLVSRVEVEDSAEAPGGGLIAFGSFTFDPESAGSLLVVPRTITGTSGATTWTTTVERATSDEPADPSLGHPAAKRSLPARGWPEEDWARAAREAIALINTGEVEKVVLARDLVLDTDSTIDVDALVDALAKDYPECFTFAFDGFIGASPELLLQVSGQKVASVVVAGTSRGLAGGPGDEGAIDELERSVKDQTEHRISVDAVARALTSACDRLSVPAKPSAMTLANAHHLSTRIEGTLRAPRDCLDLLGVLHPTPAVCGTPVPAALELIRRLEGFDRGRYSGPIGWIDATGAGEWAIALRCAEVSGSGARLFAGAGMVAASRVDDELEETRVKLRPILNAISSARQMASDTAFQSR